MENAHCLAVSHRFAGCSLVAAVMLLFSAASLAADAHMAVQAKPGDMVLLRNVSTRPADRQAPPGMALMVNPSPSRELAAALGTNELSDADYASMSASAPGGGAAHGTTVERVIGSALGGSFGSGGGNANGVAGNGISNVINGPVGMVGATTRGVGDQVQGALSQLPGMITTPSTGH